MSMLKLSNCSKHKAGMINAIYLKCCVFFIA